MYNSALTTFEGLPDSTTNELSLFVKSVILNSARTAFTINIETSQNQAGSFSTYTKLGINVFIIGHLFNIESNTIGSAFARNSKFVQITGYNELKVDYIGTNDEPSPFNYVADANSANCGITDDSSGNTKV